MLENLDRRTASRIIHSLAESGQPPKLGASYLNVGTDRIIQRLRSDYLDDLLTPFEGQDGGGACKWIEANCRDLRFVRLKHIYDHPEPWLYDHSSLRSEALEAMADLDHPELPTLLERALEEESSWLISTALEIITPRKEAVHSGPSFRGVSRRLGKTAMSVRETSSGRTLWDFQKK